MDISQLRQAVTGLGYLAERIGQGPKYSSFFGDALAALDEERAFTAFTKVANTASNMLEDIGHEKELQRAVASISYHGYQYCVNHSDGRIDFSPSRDRLQELAAEFGGAVSCSVALETIHEYLNPSAPTVADSAPEDSSGDSAVDSFVTLPTDVPSEAPSRFFEEAVSVPIGRRLADYLVQWGQDPGELVPNTQAVSFERRLRALLEMGETGRQFGDFAILDDDMDECRPSLERLEVPRRPQDIQDCARVCRSLATIDFRSADATTFRSARGAWLASAFWNSSLTELWATNEEQFVHDVLGYLTALQAEHRYATHEEQVLLLLRVSHLICRIGSSEDLVPTNFYEKFGAIESWIRYTVGTVLAISGPGRVPPSRLRNDPRLVDERGRQLEREEFGAKLMPSWRRPAEREATCAILLELAGWDLLGASRLVRSVLHGADAECEVWVSALTDLVERAKQVKVLRPNPWASGEPGKMVTADTHALAVLASDVIHRAFPAIGGNISLNGTSFRDRRVPTFVCSADFGPLGLFKADARERIDREASNFTLFAQRLHPRYRASRCDRSVAVISEPDDRIEFVAGLLTSYVFTEREAPRSLNSWFQANQGDVVLGLVRELFFEALRPWYDHATRGVLDVLAEYELFTRAGIARLEGGLSTRGDLGVTEVPAIEWLKTIVAWVNGELPSASHEVETQAASLQLCETFRSVSHGDLHLDNILVLGKDGAEYPCLIDFETTGKAHLLRDFGRFVGGVLFRTHSWTSEELEQLKTLVPSALTALGSKRQRDSTALTDRVAKVLDVIELVSESYGSQWRVGTGPDPLELAAVLVCSFLPFARYPDTEVSSAKLALTLASKIVEDLPSELAT